MLTYIFVAFFIICTGLGIALSMNIWGKANDVAAAARAQLNNPPEVRVVYMMAAAPPQCFDAAPPVPPVPADPNIDINPTFV